MDIPSFSGLALNDNMNFTTDAVAEDKPEGVKVKKKDKKTKKGKRKADDEVPEQEQEIAATKKKKKKKRAD